MDPFELVKALAAELDPMDRGRPVTVAIDGPDGSGRSTLADRLAAACRSQGRPVVRIAEQDFLQPHRIRDRRGSEDAEGFFEDTFDYAALRHLVLAPLTDGDRSVVRRIRDPSTDDPVYVPAEQVPENAVVIVDGPFLLRKALRGYWSLGVLLETAPFGPEGTGQDDGATADRSTRRARGFALYLDRDDPGEAADIVIDTTDAQRPVPIRWP
jgi:uridine kinase